MSTQQDLDQSQFEYHFSAKSPSDAIVDAVARANGENVEGIDIGVYITDVAALDRLLTSTNHLEVSFRMEGAEIEVSSDGRISIRAIREQR